MFAATVGAGLTVSPALMAVDQTTSADFKKTIQPLLEEYCYDCHGDGAKKGGVAFDELNPKFVQTLGDSHLVERRKRNARSLSSIPQSGVVDS